MIKEEIFQIIEASIKNTKIEDFNIYDVCSNLEKLCVIENKDGSFSYRILKNYVILKFYPMKKVKNAIEIRDFDYILPNLNNKFEEIKHPKDSNYFRINISNNNDIKHISNELSYIFKELFLQYISNEESFGCCSKYIDCSNVKHCINNNIRFRIGCLYKRNLNDGKIFYGKNKNIK